MKPETASRAGEVTYIVYDKATGTIIQTYSKLDVKSDKHVEVPIEELREEFARDQSVLARLTDQKAENLDVLKVDYSAAPPRSAGMVVDVASRKLICKPSLRLKSSKTQLNGDGTDNTEIEVEVVDADGDSVRNFNDDLRITTSRGKLSERGGLVKMVRGRAKIELTSVSETVRKVRVRAESVGGKAGPDEIVLEFV